jgi:hypothetical protein
MAATSTATVNQVIHVFTDVGVKDIDDELLIKFLCEKHGSPLDLTFVFTGSDGVSPAEALEYWKKIFEPSVLAKKNPGSIVNYTTLPEYMVLESVECDYALQISPGNGYDGENLTVREKYIFAGDFVTPEGGRDSFNKNGSDAILTKFSAEGKLVEIPSAHMAKMRFNKELLSKFDGPFVERIVFTAFLLAFCRMHPKCPVSQKFAEGLVNPNVGRGVNYENVMKMAQNLGISDISNSEGIESATKAAVKYFCDIFNVTPNYCKVVGSGVDAYAAAHCPLKDPDSVQHLIVMNTYLNAIHQKACSGDEYYLSDLFASNDNEVFYSNFDIDSVPYTLTRSWEYFKANADDLVECFNPVYDLFAGYVLVGLLQGEDRTTDSVDTFQSNIVKEF